MGLLRLTTLFLLLGCSSSKFTGKQHGRTGGDDQEVVESPKPTPENPPKEEPPLITPSKPIGLASIRLVKPALAVTSPTCLVCHADVTGNLVTTFAHNTSDFVIATTGGSRRADAWHSLNLKGDLIVPKYRTNDSSLVNEYKAYDPTIVDLSIRDLFLKPHSAECAGGSAPCQMIKTIDKSRSTSTPGVNAVTEIDEIAINIPTEAELLALPAKNKSNLLLASQNARLIALGDANATGFALRAGASSPFVAASGTLTCNGDLLIEGTLFLENLTVNGTCRLYVTGSVFIKGGINSGAGFQIVSSRAVVMGIMNLTYRMDHGSNFQPESFKNTVLAESVNVAAHTEEAGPHLELKQTPTSPVVAISYLPTDVRGADIKTTEHGAAGAWQTVNGHTLFAFDPLKCVRFDNHYDAAVHDCVMPNISYNRISANYDHVMIAAKVVHSRYHGRFRGVVIADYALFALQHFVFEYDSIFEGKKVFPLLDKVILHTK